MSERPFIIIEAGSRRIQWCCEAGYLHIIWPDQLKPYEIEAITELFQMALKQMGRLASNPAPERTGSPNQAQTTTEQTSPSQQGEKP